MQDLKDKTGRSEDWLKEKILLKPAYMKKLDIDRGGFVYYPESRGDKWCFLAKRMEEFLTNHFVEIFKLKGERP
ncbi:DUF771 domain-containing protein [Alkalicoccobacillus plakortidis]